MSRKLPVNDFERIKDTSQFDKDFIKIIIKKVIKDIFLKLMFNILKNNMTSDNDLPLLSERMKIG